MGYEASWIEAWPRPALNSLPGGAFALTRPAEEVQNRQRERYSSARHRLNETISIGRLVLPQHSQNTLAKFELEIQRRQSFEHYSDAHDHDAGIIGAALEALIDQGRQNLGVEKLEHGR